MTPGRIRVLLVDDQKLFVESLKYVLDSRAPDIEVIGIARDGQEAIARAHSERPDVVLMDVRMPGVDGVEATKAIRQLHPETRVLMLSTFEEDDLVSEAIRQGAVGYLVKNIAPEKVIDSVRAVMAGILQISPGAARAVMKKGAMPRTEMPADRAVALQALTRRERQVLALLAAAHENREIAAFLDVTEQTARNYVHNLYSKLGVSNRVQLMKILPQLDLPD